MRKIRSQHDKIQHSCHSTNPRKFLFHRFDFSQICGFFGIEGLGSCDILSTAPLNALKLQSPALAELEYRWKASLWVESS